MKKLLKEKVYIPTFIPFYIYAMDTRLYFDPRIDRRLYFQDMKWKLTSN